MTNGDWMPAQAPFDLVRRGYSPEQVTAHLERLEYDLRITTANRDASAQRLTELQAQLGAAQAETDGLRSQMDRLALEPVSMSNLSDRMQRMIRLAEEEATDIRSRAETDAQRLRGQLETALAEAAETRQSFDTERERTRKQLADQVHHLISEATTEAQETRTHAQEEATRLLQEANAQAEHTVMDAREYAENTTGEANRTTEVTVREANEQAARTIAEAEQHAAEVRGTAQAETGALLVATAAERERLDAESSARRAQEEQDFEVSITGRRAEGAKQVADREAASVAAAEQREAESIAAAGQRDTESRTSADKLIADAQSEADLLMQRATTYANALVNRAAADSSRRVSDADQAVTALQELRAHLNEQLRSLAGHLDHIRNLAGSAPDLLTTSTRESARPRGEQFPSDPAARPTDVGPAPVLRTGPPQADEDSADFAERAPTLPAEVANAPEAPQSTTEDMPASETPPADEQPPAADVAPVENEEFDPPVDDSSSTTGGFDNGSRPNGRVRTFGARRR